MHRGELGELGRIVDSHLLRSDVKARHDGMVEFTRGAMSDECGAMSAGHGNAWAGRDDDDSRRLTADNLRPTTSGRPQITATR